MQKSSHKVIKILGLFLLCVAVIVGSYQVTSAWFIDESVTSNGKPNINVIGTIDLDVITNFDFYNLALAPDTIYTTDQNSDDIGTYIGTSTKNNIKDIYIRTKFTTNRSELTLFFDGNLTSKTTFDPDDDTLEDKWVYNETDGYYYYLGAVGSTKIKFNTGYKVDNTLNNAPTTNNAGEEVDINMLFEAIQRPYGAYKYDTSWSTAPEIFKDFAAYDSGVAWR